MEARLPGIDTEIFIGLGSNINKTQNLRSGLAALRACFSKIALSPIYESEAIGFQGKAFYNAVMQAHTVMPLEEVIQQLKRIEFDHGRMPGEARFTNKRLDLDLLLYNGETTETPVTLPRPEILYNAFVLLPLSQLVPGKRHPVTGTTYQQLWQSFDKSKQSLSLAPVQWEAL